MQLLLIEGPGFAPRRHYERARLHAVTPEHDCHVIEEMDPAQWPDASTAPDALLLHLDSADNECWRAPQSYMPEIRRAAAEARRRWPETPMILCGRAVRLFGKEWLERIPQAGCAAIGQLEATVPDILEHLDSRTAKGCIYRDENELRITDPPARLFLEDLPRQKRFSEKLVCQYADGTRVAALETSRRLRGVPGHTAESVLYGRDEDVLPIEALVEILQRLAHDEGVRRIHFLDPVFGPQTRIADLACAILRARLNLAWSASLDPLQVEPGVLTLAAASGCEAAEILVPGTTVAALRALGRMWPISVLDTALDAFRRVRSIRLTLRCLLHAPRSGFFRPHPLMGLYRKWRRLPASARGDFRLDCARIFPHTPLHSMAIEEGRCTSADPLLPAGNGGMSHCFYDSMAARATRVFLPA